MTKDKIILKLMDYEARGEIVEFYQNEEKREKHKEFIRKNYKEEDAKEILKVFQNKLNRFANFQTFLNINLNQFPELIKEDNGFIHTKFYDFYTCKFTDEDVKYREKQLADLIESGIFISIADYLREQEKIIIEYKLDQKEDANEIEIRTMDNLIKKYKGEKIK